MPIFGVIVHVTSRLKINFGHTTELKVEFLIKCRKAFVMDKIVCERVLGQNCKNIQIVDKELAKVLVIVAPVEICIIRQFLDKYPKLIEKHCEKQTSNKQNLTVSKNELMQKKVLLKTECRYSDYGTEELLEHSYNKQVTPIEVRHNIENEVEIGREIKYVNASQQGKKVINNIQIEQVDKKGRKRVVLWDLPKSFAAECVLEINNELCKKLLQEAWVLPYKKIIKAIRQKVVFQEYNLTWHRLDEQLNDIEMQEVEKSSKKGYNRNERRNIEEDGYREQNYRRESEYIKKKNFVDTYREVNPKRFESTWEGYRNKSRIDYIWHKKSANIDKYLPRTLEQAGPKISDQETSSSTNKSTEQGELNRKWKVIEEGIIQAAEEILPKKNVQRNMKEDIKKIQVIFGKFGNKKHLDVLAIWNVDLYKQLTKYWQIYTNWKSSRGKQRKNTAAYQRKTDEREEHKEQDEKEVYRTSSKVYRVREHAAKNQLDFKSSKNILEIKSERNKSVCDNTSITKVLVRQIEKRMDNVCKKEGIATKIESLLDIEHWCKKGNLIGSKIVLKKCESCKIRQEQEEASCVIATRFKIEKKLCQKVWFKKKIIKLYVV
ncbi:43511_t:CDS:10 [Gigaspora margarita]|uniref:43511_t:CDS:1 n=1 Tax=Gigaspora margarita TaxID=4874 RepID=A0ABN7UGB1_GIGMA|nr:43511_t:CDS:10 [Gigaspora margarita]